MERKHTPGPWALGRFGVILGGPFREYTNGKAQSQIASACLVQGSDGAEGEREANARLMAAAPDLLEAAEQAMACAQSLNQEMTDAYAALSAAIRKATVDQATPTEG